MTKEEWHEIYIKNKNKFTSSKQKAEEDKNLIYVEKAQEYTHNGLQDMTQDLEEGNWGTLYRHNDNI